MSDAPYAVLLVAYGAPLCLDEVEPYLLDVRGGRPTPSAVVEELRARYAAIGGRSPLLDRTVEQAAALSRTLGGRVPVLVGMRHWHPYINAVLAEAASRRIRRVVAIAMAPHYSRVSVGAYQRTVENARGPIDVAFVPQWPDHPGFLDAAAERVRAALQRFPGQVRDTVPIVFTAHSLPEGPVVTGDPYVEQLGASVTGVMSRLKGTNPYQLAFQSAGRSNGAWLGPDAGEVLEGLVAAGERHLLVCPIGFVADHLEVLYDVDIEYRRRAQESGARLERTESLNAHPLLIGALADLVTSTAQGRGWAQ